MEGAKRAEQRVSEWPSWMREMSGFAPRSPSPSDLADSIALHAGSPVTWVECYLGARSDHWLWSRGDCKIELILDDEGDVSLTADGIGYLPELAAADLLGRLLATMDSDPPPGRNEDRQC